MDYVHFNPVKHGWVEKVIDWPYSSFHCCVERGIYFSDWASDAQNDMEMGE
jgi:putative transposase